MFAQMNIKDDLYFMKLAIEEAYESEKKQRGDPSYPPAVGAVVVLPGQGVIAQAHRSDGHEKNAHAEFIALKHRLGGHRIAGAILYTTLEPCIDVRSYEKEDCSVRVVKAGIREVVVGMLDPDPRVCAKGVLYLQKHGVIVRRFPENLEQEIRQLNKPFIEAVANRSRRHKPQKRKGKRPIVLSFVGDYQPDPIAIKLLISAYCKDLHVPEIRWSDTHEALWESALAERSNVIERLRLKSPGGEHPDTARESFEHVDSAIDFAWKIRVAASERLPMIWKQFITFDSKQSIPKKWRENWFEKAITRFLSICDAQCLYYLCGTQPIFNKKFHFTQGEQWALFARKTPSRIYARIYDRNDRFLRKTIYYVGSKEVGSVNVYAPKELFERYHKRYLTLQEFICHEYVLPQVEYHYIGNPLELEWSAGAWWEDLRDDDGNRVDEGE